jgi:putative endonuclease
MNRQQAGRRGEREAERFLRDRGYRILERNWRSAHGEIDLIAGDGETIVFVEVKLRRGTAFGRPEEAVTPAKQRHLVDSAQDYLEEKGMEEADWRIDVVAIELHPGGALARLDHFIDAVEEPTQDAAESD